MGCWSEMLNICAWLRLRIISMSYSFNSATCWNEMEGLLLSNKAGVEGKKDQLLNSSRDTKVFECQMLNSSAFNRNFAMNLLSPGVRFLSVPVSLIVMYFK